MRKAQSNMSWELRVIKTIENSKTSYDIHYCYIAADGTVMSIRSDRFSPKAENKREFLKNIQELMDCIKRPMLTRYMPQNKITNGDGVFIEKKEEINAELHLQLTQLLSKGCVSAHS